jgi:hypothetical protein
MTVIGNSLWVPPILSLLVPGGGQAYNRDFLKTGIFAAGEIVVGGLLYNEYKNNGERESAYRDIFIGILLFSVADAYISAELKDVQPLEDKSDTIKTK